jgi:membrane protein
MSSNELPLYPKISSIYNKIMQLAIAIVLIIVVMNLWLAASDNNTQAIHKHFNRVGQDYLRQATANIASILASHKIKSDKQFLQRYLNSLITAKSVESASFYDSTGLLVLSAGDQLPIKALFGVSKNKLNISEHYVPFVGEIRSSKPTKDTLGEVQGYIRLTLKKTILTAELEQVEQDRSKLERLMLIIAGFIGFLLTRGLNRFSRQGYRLAR